MMIANMPAVLPMVKAGRLRALAVTSVSRSSLMPDLPTVADDLPGFEVIVWYGVLAPAATPAPVIARLNGYLRQMAGMPEVRERLAGQGAEAISSTPDEFARKSFIAKIRNPEKRSAMQLNYSVIQVSLWALGSTA